MANQLYNFTISNNFRVTVPELPMITDLAQDVTIPAITLPETIVPNRHVEDKQPGEKLVFTELDIGFTVDENWDTYAEIWSWMALLAGPDGMSQQIVTERQILYVDIVIEILNNARKAVRRLKFYDCWPTAIGAVSLDTTGDDINTKGIVTMSYTAMDIDPPGKNLTGFTDIVYSH